MAGFAANLTGEQVMPNPSSVIQTTIVAGSTMTLPAPVTAGKRVVVILTGSGPASGSLTATINDDSGTVYSIDDARNNFATNGVLIASGIVPDNGTNATTTITVTGANFTIIVAGAIEFNGASGSPLRIVDEALNSGTFIDNALTSYDSDGLGSLIVTGMGEGTGRVTTFSTTGSTVDDFTELFNAGVGVAITMGQTDASDDPSTAVTVTATYTGGTAFRPVMVSIAYKLAPADASGFTSTRRQTAVNKNQNGYAIIAPDPPGTGFASPVTITANCTNGTSNFIRQSDGVQTTGSVTLVGEDTAVMQVFSTQSSASIIYSWTTNDAAITSPAATSFTVNAIESSYQAATPDGGWDPTIPGSGFSSTPTASTVSHGTNFTGIAILAGTDRVWGEYVTTGQRTITAALLAHGDPSSIESVDFLTENNTPVVARNDNLWPTGSNWWAHGVVFSADGAVSHFTKAKPFNGPESIYEGLTFFDIDGAMPKITGTINNFTEFLTAANTDPSDTLAIYYVPGNTDIVFTATAFQSTYTLTGVWSSTHPIIFEGADWKTSRITCDLADGWWSKFYFPIQPASYIVKNMTVDFSFIGVFSVDSHSLIFDHARIVSSLPEDSRHRGDTNYTIFENAFNGTWFINGTKAFVYGTQGLTGIRGLDGVINLAPDVTVGADFFQNLATGWILNAYARRYSHQGYEPTLPLEAVLTLTATATVFEPGTNSNLTRITATGWPTYDGAEYLENSESIFVTSGPLVGSIIPVVIGRTKVDAGFIYAAGDITSLGAATFQISALFQQRMNQVALVLSGPGVDNMDGTTTIPWTDAGDAGLQFSTRVQFYSNTTTTSLRNFRFDIVSIDTAGHTVTVTGDASDAVAGDTIWFMAIYHADAFQIGLQNGQTANAGPIVAKNYLNVGFQTGLTQAGTVHSVTNIGLINNISVGFPFQVQQNNSNMVFTNWTAITTFNPRTNAPLNLENTFVNNSILQATLTDVAWNDDMVITNSHGIENALPGVGVGNTDGAIVLNGFYNSTTSSLQERVWNTNIRRDIYGNQATTNGSTYSRIGAVLGDPIPVVPPVTLYLGDGVDQAGPPDVFALAYSNSTSTYFGVSNIGVSNWTATPPGSNWSLVGEISDTNFATGDSDGGTPAIGGIYFPMISDSGTGNAAIYGLGMAPTVTLGGPSDALTNAVADYTWDSDSVIVGGTLTLTSDPITGTFSVPDITALGSAGTFTFTSSVSGSYAISATGLLPDNSTINFNIVTTVFTDYVPPDSVGSIMNSYAAMALSGMEQTLAGAAFRSMNFPSILGAGTYKVMIASGIGTGQANVLASVVGTVTAGTPLDIDLTDIPAAGTMEPIVLTGVKGILIQETSAPIGSNYLLVGDSSGTLTNAWRAPWTVATGQDRVGSGGAKVRYNPLGYTVDSSHKILRLNADSGTVLFQLDIIGTA